MRLPRLRPGPAALLPLSALFLTGCATGHDGLAVVAAGASVGVFFSSAGAGSAGVKRVAGFTAAGAAVAATAVAGAALLGLSTQSLLGGLPVMGFLLLAWHFGATLLPGREPLIRGYTRLDGAVPSPALDRYTRGLTMIWTGLFLSLAMLNAAPLLGAGIDAGTVLALSVALNLGLFFGEHALRGRLLPGHAARPLRTLRAIWLAGAAAPTTRHAG